VYLNEDIWWNGNWNHEDVKGRGRQAAASIVIPASDSFTLTLLGFEGCCDGINSGRYQSLAHGLTPFLRSETGADPIGVESSTGWMGNRGGSDPFSPLAFDASNAGIVADPEGWTALAVNAVPAPASLPLFGLGAALLVFGRRRRDARGIR
jgi:hypothetical protein